MREKRCFLLLHDTTFCMETWEFGSVVNNDFTAVSFSSLTPWVTKGVSTGAFEATNKPSLVQSSWQCRRPLLLVMTVHPAKLPVPIQQESYCMTSTFPMLTKLWSKEAWTYHLALGPKTV